MHRLFGLLFWLCFCHLFVIADFEQTSAQWNLVTNNDTLRDTFELVFLAVDCCVVKMLLCLLKACKLQRGSFRLSHAVTLDP